MQPIARGGGREGGHARPLTTHSPTHPTQGYATIARSHRPPTHPGLCYNVLKPTNPSGIEIRAYGIPPNASLVTGIGSGVYVNGVSSSIASALSYLAGANDEQRNILTARIVPFAITPPRPGVTNSWTANIGISTIAFPDDFLIPRPNRPVIVSRVSANFVNLAAFQFNTTGMPYEENFLEACGGINNSTLPSGWAVNTTSIFSPTYVFYNGMTPSQNFTNECWKAVYQV